MLEDAMKRSVPWRTYLHLGLVLFLSTCYFTRNARQAAVHTAVMLAINGAVDLLLGLVVPTD